MGPFLTWSVLASAAKLHARCVSFPRQLYLNDIFFLFFLLSYSLSLTPSLLHSSLILSRPSLEDPSGCTRDFTALSPVKSRNSAFCCSLSPP